MVPFQALQMVGHTVDAVCPNKKKGSMSHRYHDFEEIRPTPKSPGTTLF